MAETEAPGVESSAEGHGFWTKAVWYVPNRVLDLLDIVRVRVRVGPGLDVGARVTDVASFYAGRSHAVVAGLPGPRRERRGPELIGWENRRGMVILGVDATDDLPHPPRYAFSEIGASAHLLLVGAEAAVAPDEAIDFLAGIFGSDLKGDDLPRPEPRLREKEGVLAGYAFHPEYPLDPKPETFPSLTSRLDYLYVNVPRRVRGEFHELDGYFLEKSQIHEPQPPVNDLRLSFEYQAVSGPGSRMEFEPNLEIHVELPNLEREMSLFIQSSYDDDLPGVDPVNRDDKGWSIGARRQLDRWDISGDIGVHSGWKPELFSRVAWKPDWNWDEWRMGFEHRLFWENEDGFGFLSSLKGYRWVGSDDDWLIRNVTAGRFSESTTGYEWQQTVQFGHMTRLFEEEKRTYNIDIDDTVGCVALKASVFGRDRQQTEYRTTLVLRRNVYNRFVVWEVEPGLQWRNEHDWTTQYRIDTALILVF